ncbi:MAG: long-chain fatty acid--CoA ligase [Deltaproteobacteria bacterium]|nr:long-chain fatty acid--CoA ligase [Deltaproteobacteria bacterium]MCB9478231.1 long-chain fatty acid--CoA ligase [Deltaproteobacteria bacterium]MCB9487216.1 long-chain fatty acid--CoA ligase [Deltaproteobacteria bacterium]
MNDPVQVAYDTVPRLFADRVSRYGDRVALRRKEFGLWRAYSWTDYGAQVELAFYGMAALGVEPGECVALISENRPEWLFVDLAILHHGAITAAVYVTNAASQVHYILEHSESRVFFVENEEQLDKWLEVRDRLPDLKHVVVMDMDGLKHFSDPAVMSYEEFLDLGRQEKTRRPSLFEERAAAVKGLDPAIIVYTSGTTGPPKGAVLTHSNLLWTTASMGMANPMFETDEVLSFLPLCHIAERVMTTFNQLTFGYTVNFAESLETVPQNLREVSPTVFFAVPRIWEKFASRVSITMREADWSKRVAYRWAERVGREYAKKRVAGERISFFEETLAKFAHFAVLHPLKKRLGLERVRFAISGAAPISKDILEFFHGMGLWVREVYGQTEGSGPATIHYADRIKPGTVGRPIPGCDVKIAEDGEILVRGGNVFAGYYRNEAATRQTLVDGWLYSGDIGCVDDEGFLRITDRKKDLIINAAGKNIAPQNIENQLKASPYINDAVAIGDRRPFVTALILIDEEQVVQYAQQHRIPFTTYASLASSPEIRELIDGEVKAVNAQLARVEQVKAFTILSKRLEQEDGELTPTMKVKRQKIAELYGDVIEALYRR